MTKRESRSVNEIVRLKTDHRRVKTPEKDAEESHPGKRREKRLEQHWAAQLAEEGVCPADYGNAV